MLVTTSLQSNLLFSLVFLYPLVWIDRLDQLWKSRRHVGKLLLHGFWEEEKVFPVNVILIFRWGDIFSKGSAQEFVVGVALGALRGGLICWARDSLSAILTFFCSSTHLSNVLKLSSCVVIVIELKYVSIPFIRWADPEVMRQGDPFRSCFKLNLHVHTRQSKRLMADKLTPAALSYKWPAAYDNL